MILIFFFIKKKIVKECFKTPPPPPPPNFLKEKSGPSLNNFKRKSKHFQTEKRQFHVNPLKNKKVMKFRIFVICMKHFLNNENK